MVSPRTNCFWRIILLVSPDFTFHVFTGYHALIFGLIFATANGVFEKEDITGNDKKVGLYWHFVDLVWYSFMAFYFNVI